MVDGLEFKFKHFNSYQLSMLITRGNLAEQAPKVFSTATEDHYYFLFFKIFLPFAVKFQKFALRHKF